MASRVGSAERLRVQVPRLSWGILKLLYRILGFQDSTVEDGDALVQMYARVFVFPPLGGTELRVDVLPRRIPPQGGTTNLVLADRTDFSK